MMTNNIDNENKSEKTSQKMIWCSIHEIFINLKVAALTSPAYTCSSQRLLVTPHFKRGRYQRTTSTPCGSCTEVRRKARTCELSEEPVADEPQQWPDVQLELLFGEVDAELIQHPGEGRVHVSHHLHIRQALTVTYTDHHRHSFIKALIQTFMLFFLIPLQYILQG